MIRVDALTADGAILLRVIPKIGHPRKSRKIKSPGPIAAFRSFRAEAGQLYNHKLGIEFSQLIIAQTEFIQYPRPEILQNRIRLARQFSDQLGAGRMFEIDGKRSDAEVALDEPRRRVDVLVLAVVTKGIEPALLRFDLDHLGAVAGEQAPGVRAGVPCRKSENANAFENLAGRHGIKNLKLKIQTSDRSHTGQIPLFFILPFNFEVFFRSLFPPPVLPTRSRSSQARRIERRRYVVPRAATATARNVARRS